jgi:hypothetical protein
VFEFATEFEATFNVEEATRFEPAMPITTVNLELNARICDTIVTTNMFIVLLMYATNFHVQLTLNPSRNL